MDPARLRFRFVPGYSIPEGSPVTTADRTPSTWTAHLVAAFNGGFKLRDHVGGYYYRGRTVSPLRTGLAAFVVRQDGTLSVGVWGRDLRMSRSVVVVRENLRPLVDHAVVTASPSDSASTWGIANGGRPLANRTALARLPDGSLVFAYGHDVTALTLGRALVRVGAVEAVDLDMNISWPTGFVYHHTGSGLAGARINPGVVRPPSTYFHQFYKDFVAVESR
ncbi:MAG: hypothetical protein GC157_13590 [Frankiales bacterium]|nr:hypothetical protein [Frankiales bacterium]